MPIHHRLPHDPPAHPVRPSTLLALLALLLAPSLAAAYPIPPVPLWSLVERADLIVVAQVEEVQRVEDPDDGWNDAFAVLRVDETLHGPVEAVVRVPFAANLLCPAPARYPEGETVLAFLELREGLWSTIGLSYGTLQPEGEDLEDYRAMIAAALELLARELEPEQLSAAKLDWLVDAATLPGTRWHGLYELAGRGSRWVAMEEGEESVHDVPTLTEAHRQRLAEALLESPRYDPTLPSMLELLRAVPDPRLDRFAAGLVESLLERDEPPWWTADLLQEVLVRRGEALDESEDDWREVSGLRRHWQAAKVRLGIVPESLALPESSD